MLLLTIVKFLNSEINLGRYVLAQEQFKVLVSFRLSLQRFERSSLELQGTILYTKIEVAEVLVVKTGTIRQG